jgi:RyR domain
MARIDCKPGSQGTSTEYYTYSIINPTVRVQRDRDYWLIGITHVDGSWQVAASCPNRDAAQQLGRTLLEQYATAIVEHVSDDVTLAHDVVEHYAHLTLGMAEHPSTAPALDLPDLEEVAAQVHQAWLAQKHQAGITSHRLQETGEELCVPYEALSEVAKELDRTTVRTVYAAIIALGR